MAFFAKDFCIMPRFFMDNGNSLQQVAPFLEAQIRISTALLRSILDIFDGVEQDIASKSICSHIKQSLNDDKSDQSLSDRTINDGHIRILNFVDKDTSFDQAEKALEKLKDNGVDAMVLNKNGKPVIIIKDYDEQRAISVLGSKDKALELNRLSSLRDQSVKYGLMYYAFENNVTETKFLVDLNRQHIPYEKAEDRILVPNSPEAKQAIKEIEEGIRGRIHEKAGITGELRDYKKEYNHEEQARIGSLIKSNESEEFYVMSAYDPSRALHVKQGQFEVIIDGNVTKSYQREGFSSTVLYGAQVDKEIANFGNPMFLSAKEFEDIYGEQTKVKDNSLKASNEMLKAIEKSDKSAFLVLASASNLNSRIVLSGTNLTIYEVGEKPLRLDLNIPSQKDQALNEVKIQAENISKSGAAISLSKKEYAEIEKAEAFKNRVFENIKRDIESPVFKEKTIISAKKPEHHITVTRTGFKVYTGKSSKTIKAPSVIKQNKPNPNYEKERNAYLEQLKTEISKLERATVFENNEYLERFLKQAQDIERQSSGKENTAIEKKEELLKEYKVEIPPKTVLDDREKGSWETKVKEYNLAATKAARNALCEDRQVQIKNFEKIKEIEDKCAEVYKAKLDELMLEYRKLGLNNAEACVVFASPYNKEESFEHYFILNEKNVQYEEVRSSIDFLDSLKGDEREIAINYFEKASELENNPFEAEIEVEFDAKSIENELSFDAELSADDFEISHDD